MLTSLQDVDSHGAIGAHHLRHLDVPINESLSRIGDDRYLVIAANAALIESALGIVEIVMDGCEVEERLIDSRSFGEVTCSLYLGHPVRMLHDLVYTGSVDFIP